MRKSIGLNVEQTSTTEDEIGIILSGVAVDNSDGRTGADQKDSIVKVNHLEITLSPAQINIVTGLKESI